MKEKEKDEEEKKKEEKKRIRSPNYPVLTLGRSLELADILYKKHNRYAVALEVAAKAWDISPKSTYMARHVAALASYGLIDTEGEKDAKKIKLSDLAFKILVDKRSDSSIREALIKEAALKPEMFKKIYNAYPSELPGDDALDFDLKTQYKFNPVYVPDFISIFKRTIDYAKVYKSGIMGSENPPMEEPEMIPNSDKIPGKQDLETKKNPLRCLWSK